MHESDRIIFVSSPHELLVVISVVVIYAALGEEVRLSLHTARTEHAMRVCIPQIHRIPVNKQMYLDTRDTPISRWHGAARLQ